MADANYDEEGEIWKPVPGYENLEASSLGRLRSVGHFITRSNPFYPDKTCRRFHPGKVLKGRKTPFGYLTISVKEGSRRAPRFVHRLVCTAFHGARPDGMFVAHGDGNRANNRPDNLRWATPSENSRDQIIHGTSLRGEANHKAKLTEQEVLEIIALHKSTRSRSALARRFGVHRGTIDMIVSGRNWAHLPR